MRLMFVLMTVALTLQGRGAERVLSFAEFPVDAAPTGFHSLVAGRGKPGDWKIILDEVPPALAPLTSRAVSVTEQAVLAQQAREAVGAHFPLLVFDGDTYGDFSFKTRFKLVGGALEQSAGLVFRFQNQSNFFLVLASGLSGNLLCTKVVNGVMMPPLPLNPPKLDLAKGVWHELSVQCEGTRITCTLDGNEAIKLVDNASSGIIGKLGFCTRADAVSYFADAKVTFTPREIMAQKIVRDALTEYSKLLALKIFSARPGDPQPVVVASKFEKELGQPAGAAEQDVIRTGHSYYGKGRETVTVVLPLRDHNGDPMAAVSLEMKSFPGQTEDNALVRAQPIIRQMQAQVQSKEDLLN